MSTLSARPQKAKKIATWERFRAEVESRYEPPLRKRGTWHAVRGTFKALESVGVNSFADLDRQAVAAFCSRPGLAISTRRGQLGYLRVICGYAVDWNYIQDDPTISRTKWITGSARARPGCHLPAEQIAAILKQSDNEAGRGGWQAGRLQGLTYLLSYLGLRRAEALGLALADLYLDDWYLIIRRNPDRDVKTDAAEAALPLAEPLVAVLRRVGSPLRRAPGFPMPFGSRSPLAFRAPEMAIA